MFRKLLVPLDRSDLAEQALGQAAALARGCNASVDLVLVHQPLPFNGFGDAPWNTELGKGEQAYIEGIAAELRDGSSVPVTSVTLVGEAGDMICQRAWDTDADLIVMTSHGRTGLSRAWLGSVSDRVLRHASVPVLILRPTETEQQKAEAHHLAKSILVPLDDSPLAISVLAAAGSLAKCLGATVTLMRVVQPVPLITPEAGVPIASLPVMLDDPATQQLLEEARQEMMRIAREFGDTHDVKAEMHVEAAGHVASAILDYAKAHDIDLIAMATRGRGVSRLLLGSVADKVLRGSELPMLLFRPLAVGETAGNMAKEMAEASS